MTSSTTRRWPIKAMSYLASNLSLTLNTAPGQSLAALLIICHCLPPNKTRCKVNDLKVDYSGGLGKGRSSLSRDLNPAWLYWLSSPTQRWPIWSRDSFGLKSVLDLEHHTTPGQNQASLLTFSCCLFVSRCYSAGRGKYTGNPLIRYKW